MSAFKKVLFIDDDFITVNICERMMNLVQFADEFVSARDGQVAKEYLQNNIAALPDIIFVDLHMTVMNGWEFLAWFNNWSKSLDVEIPVYVLSSSLSREDFERTYEYSTNGYIIKPMTIEHLDEIYAKFSV